MTSTNRAVGVACLLCAALLTGCGPDDPAGSDRPGPAAGPTATTTAAPPAAARLADGYREAGGSDDVYGIEVGEGTGGVPLIVVRTHSRDDDAAFQESKASLTGFLRRAEGVPLEDGYLLDVYGPDGSLQHRLDARP